MKETLEDMKKRLKDQEKKIAILLGENARLILKQKDVSYTKLSKKLKVGNSYITTRLQGKKEFTEEEMKTIKNMSKGKIEDTYIKYNQLQYDLLKIKDYNKMNEAMAQLLVELLNEMEELK